MEINKKNLWCPKCKIYPDDIYEQFFGVTQTRFWNGDEYELRDVDFGEVFDSKCGECDTILEDKPQEEAANA